LKGNISLIFLVPNTTGFVKVETAKIQPKIMEQPEIGIIVFFIPD
jgi:hypothetical protein